MPDDRRMGACTVVVVRDPWALMQAGFAARATSPDADARTVARAVADYIAGMTDRYALEDHAKLFDPAVRV